MPQNPAAPNLLIVVNYDWFFLSHRLPIARAARRIGLNVSVAATDTGSADRIRREGLEFIPVSMTVNGQNPLKELRVIAAFVRMYRERQPDVVHHVTVKPVLYGSLAAWMVGGMGVVNAVSGLGYLFMESTRARLLRPLVKGLYRVALRHRRSRTIFQNPDDRDLFVGARLLSAEQAILIRGSGVNCDIFVPQPEPDGIPVVMLPARILWDKGVGEFVEAARLIRQHDTPVRFVLVGAPDPGNPAAVPTATVEAWVREGVIEAWGHQRVMPEVLSSATLVVLPSYREGLPKALLEAAACGKPVVTTDVPGCREIVRHNVNGLLVPVRNAPALADAIRLLLQSPPLRQRFGRAGRLIAEREFAEDLVIDQTLAVYRRLLGPKWPCPQVN
jgi:glycosyltransferase involved in cell wall biosynthesis